MYDDLVIRVFNMKSHMSLYGHYCHESLLLDNNIKFILFNLSTE